MSVHIRVQNRSTKKFITIIEGLSSELDLKKILQGLKRTLHVNGSLLDNGVITLTGDKRDEVASFLVEFGIVEKSQIKKHGY